jgi:hypothetical protein
MASQLVFEKQLKMNLTKQKIDTNIKELTTPSVKNLKILVQRKA